MTAKGHCCARRSALNAATSVCFLAPSGMQVSASNFRFRAEKRTSPCLHRYQLMFEWTLKVLERLKTRTSQDSTAILSDSARIMSFMTIASCQRSESSRPSGPVMAQGGGPSSQR